MIFFPFGWELVGCFFIEDCGMSMAVGWDRRVNGWTLDDGSNFF